MTALLAPGASFAQNPHEGLDGASSMPDVPPGKAAIYGQLRHPDGNDKTQDAKVILYSLAADGSPGVRSTAADASGAFSFIDVSGAAGITYLVGASYRSIPYGKRVTFEPGQEELTLVLDVDDPIDDTSRIAVGESSLRLEWIGASLGVEEVHQLSNSGEEVVFVVPGDREGRTPVYHTVLPDGATGIDTSLSGIAEGYEVEGNDLKFFGPVYGAGLELRFRYLLPIQRDDDNKMSVAWQLNTGSSRATLLYPAAGPTLSVEGLLRGNDVTLDGRSFRSLNAGPASPGRTIEVAVALPEMSTDRTAITIPRADYWLDTDDTFMQVNVELSLLVAPGAHLTGTADAPLLTFDLPERAEFLGYAQDSQTAGLFPTASGDLGMIGPLSPGKVNIAFRFRIPVGDETPGIDLRFPLSVDVLNVFVADTGVKIQTDRLHRRRPFRQGPRIYLHREAYSVEADEVVSIALELLDRGTLGRNANLVATSLFAALGAWFIVSPLVRGRSTSTQQFEQARIRSERDLVYQAIRDLEHDYETTKIEEAEYTTMRAELRARGLELLKQARDVDEPKASAKAVAAGPAFCTGCGTELDSAWQFCAKCGASTSAGNGSVPQQ
jgi:hypothetical protein